LFVSSDDFGLSAAVFLPEIAQLVMMFTGAIG
jgi:hypothetical protein